MLFADVAEATTEVASNTEALGLFPPYFWIMIAAVIIIAGICGSLMIPGWRLIDYVTPGKLNEEIVPPEGSTKQPNMALAMIVTGMIVGFSFIIGCTIIGVLMH